MENEKDIEPRFKASGKDNPFTIPDQYFADFSSRLQEKIAHEKVAAEKLQTQPVFRPRLVYVLAFVILALVSYPAIRFFNPPDKKLETSHNNMAAIVNYSIDNIETDLVIDGVLVSEMDISTDRQVNDSLVDYIESQGIEIENITEQL